MKPPLFPSRPRIVPDTVQLYGETFSREKYVDQQFKDIMGALGKWREVGDWLAADSNDAIDPELGDRFVAAREVTSILLDPPTSPNRTSEKENGF